METIELLSDPRVRALLDEAARRGAQAAIDDLVLYSMGDAAKRMGIAYCTRQQPGNGIDEDTYPEVRSGMNESELIPEDYAATRRAIVLAAAEIGRRMKS